LYNVVLLRFDRSLEIQNDRILMLKFPQLSMNCWSCCWSLQCHFFPLIFHTFGELKSCGSQMWVCFLVPTRTALNVISGSLAGFNWS